MIINKFEKRKEEFSALSEIAEYINSQINNEQNYEMYSATVNEDTHEIEQLADWQIERNERTTARIFMYQKILDMIEKMA